jgi:hypothetical protein
MSLSIAFVTDLRLTFWTSSDLTTLINDYDNRTLRIWAPFHIGIPLNLSISKKELIFVKSCIVNKFRNNLSR